MAQAEDQKEGERIAAHDSINARFRTTRRSGDRPPTSSGCRWEWWRPEPTRAEESSQPPGPGWRRQAKRSCAPCLKFNRGRRWGLGGLGLGIGVEARCAQVELSMTFDAVRKIAMALDGVEEATSY